MEYRPAVSKLVVITAAFWPAVYVSHCWQAEVLVYLCASVRNLLAPEALESLASGVCCFSQAIGDNLTLINHKRGSGGFCLA